MFKIRTKKPVPLGVLGEIHDGAEMRGCPVHGEWKIVFGELHFRATQAVFDEYFEEIWE